MKSITGVFLSAEIEILATKLSTFRFCYSQEQERMPMYDDNFFQWERCFVSCSVYLAKEWMIFYSPIITYGGQKCTPIDLRLPSAEIEKFETKVFLFPSLL